MKRINNGKLEERPKPSAPNPIKATHEPNKRLRRCARSATKPDGKLATPAMNVRADASAPAWARLNPSAVVMIGRITAITALNRCSVICAVLFAAKRPQFASGAFKVAVSALDKVQLVKNLNSVLGLKYTKAAEPASRRATIIGGNRVLPRLTSGQSAGGRKSERV